MELFEVWTTNQLDETMLSIAEKSPRINFSSWPVKSKLFCSVYAMMKTAYSKIISVSIAIVNYKNVLSK